jgi:hypothetical protein
MISLEQIEFHITDRCNLSCPFCTHYSNFHISNKDVRLQETIEHWNLWSQKITPVRFWILGGEPTLHDDFVSFVSEAKRIWAHSIVGIVSNGLALKKHQGLSEVLKNCTLAISFHGIREDDIRNQISKLNLDSSTTVEIRNSNNTWTNYYKIENGVAIPFSDGNQRQSWERCNSKKCTVLKDNKLWKCPQVAFAESVGINWFEGYEPCNLTDDIQSWLLKEDELCCSNCPAYPKFLSEEEQRSAQKLPIIQ